ncbi:MAG TPA: hypothetical protein VGD77_11280 [Gemmatimonadaceae bacterium]
MIRRMLLAGMMLLATACASAGSGTRSSYQRDLITETEMKAEATQYSNLLDVVSGLRPNWLRPPLAGSGASAASGPVVWLDGREFGEADMMKQLSKDSAVSLRYYSATAAQSKFGMREARPVIEITTRGR